MYWVHFPSHPLEVHLGHHGSVHQVGGGIPNHRPRRRNNREDAGQRLHLANFIRTRTITLKVHCSTFASSFGSPRPRPHHTTPLRMDRWKGLGLGVRVIYVRDSTKEKGFSPKLEAPWKGPCIVKARCGPVLYEILTQREKKVMHHDRLKPYTSDVIPAWIRRQRHTALPQRC